MSGDEPILTGREERAAAALRLALRSVSEEWPLRVDAAAWVASVPRRRSIGHRLPVGIAAALAVLIAGAMAFTAWPRGAGPPSPGPSLPGTPGHFDNGRFNFDLPASWKTLSGEYDEGMASQVFAVLGTGDWRTGCYLTSNGGGCTGDTVNVSGGRIVVKVWERVGGPANMCGESPANATLGPNAVLKSTDGSTTTWEIRMPGADFGWTNNVFVELWAGGPSGLAQAEALVASFRWAPGESNAGNCAPIETPMPSPSLARYHADGISFDYPASWPVISGFQHFGLNGPTVRFAIGTGIANSGCQPIAGGIDCPAGPTITAKGGQVVVMWYGGAGLGDPLLLPTGSLSPGQTRATIGGMPAIESHGDGWIKWQLSLFGYIEARWGSDAVNAEAQVDALIASLSVDRSKLAG